MRTFEDFERSLSENANKHGITNILENVILCLKEIVEQVSCFDIAELYCGYNKVLRIEFFIKKNNSESKLFVMLRKTFDDELDNRVAIYIEETILGYCIQNLVCDTVEIKQIN